VTWGAYARIRHPFYTSFLLAFVAAVAAFPHPATAACLLYATVALNVTAVREERRLLASEYGDAYFDYLQRTGRFLPRMAEV
jgi:protein-S-isoprenylcysteine O-methyltransferase Ste14